MRNKIKEADIDNAAKIPKRMYDQEPTQRAPHNWLQPHSNSNMLAVSSSYLIIACCSRNIACCWAI